jgi:hypothetical protein
MTYLDFIKYCEIPGYKLENKTLTSLDRSMTTQAKRRVYCDLEEKRPKNYAEASDYPYNKLYKKDGTIPTNKNLYFDIYIRLNPYYLGHYNVDYIAEWEDEKNLNHKVIYRQKVDRLKDENGKNIKDEKGRDIPYLIVDKINEDGSTITKKMQMEWGVWGFFMVDEHIPINVTFTAKDPLRDKPTVVNDQDLVAHIYCLTPFQISKPETTYNRRFFKTLGDGPSDEIIATYAYNTTSGCPLLVIRDQLKDTSVANYRNIINKMLTMNFTDAGNYLRTMTKNGIASIESTGGQFYFCVDTSKPEASLYIKVNPESKLVYKNLIGKEKSIDSSSGYFGSNKFSNPTEGNLLKDPETEKFYYEVEGDIPVTYEEELETIKNIQSPEGFYYE